MRDEYDFSGGVRGKYFKRESHGGAQVVLDADVAVDFPDSKSVNDALRALQRRRRKRATPRSEPASR
jgi:hypothetical protein